MQFDKPGSRRRDSRSAVIRAATLLGLLALAGCSLLPREPEPPPAPPPPPPPPPILAPLATHSFEFDPETTGVIGELQVTQSRHEDTLADIARRFNLGYEEVVNANPGVDPWLPGDGTRIVLPTQFVLPDAPHDGIVVNLAALRMFYFPKPGKDGRRVVMTYPIGIGKVGWATPSGKTTIVSKRKNPWWSPPLSVRKEHAAEGDPLPARVPPGPDNPLGNRAMNLGWQSYLIHGTNKPAGVGLRASHGCIRMYPEDIEQLFDLAALGTKVTVVNQPLLYRWHGDSLYVQSYPPHEELRSNNKEAQAEQRHALFNKAISNEIWQRVRQQGGVVDWKVTEQVVNEARGVAVPVSRRGISYDGYLASARRVENTLPEGANWDGSDGEDEPADKASGVGARRTKP
jgi:L,D-transpeptidase ErfK/SrfK